MTEDTFEYARQELGGTLVAMRTEWSRGVSAINDFKKDLEQRSKLASSALLRATHLLILQRVDPDTDENFFPLLERLAPAFLAQAESHSQINGIVKETNGAALVDGRVTWWYTESGKDDREPVVVNKDDNPYVMLPDGTRLYSRALQATRAVAAIIKLLVYKQEAPH